MARFEPVVTAARLPRTLFLVHSLAGGGAERVLSRLVGALTERDRSWTVVVATLEPRVVYPLPDCVKVCVLAPPARSVAGKLAAQVVAFVRLLALVRETRPEVIVSFMPRSNALNLAGRAWSRSWPRVVLSERVSVARNYHGLERRLVAWLVRRRYRCAERIVAVSEGVAREIERLGAPPARIVVIPNPIDVGELDAQALAGSPVPSAEGPGPLLVTAGRLAPQKGYLVLLEALAIVRRSWPARLVVLGEGPDREALLARTEALGLAEAVTWAGFVPNPFPTVARADVFVLASRWEGFPNALLEAMALGRPVVASDCEWGPAELLEGGEHGLLVPPGDPEALAAAIARLLADDGLRRGYGAKARRRALHYGLRAVAGRYASVLNGVGRP